MSSKETVGVISQNKEPSTAVKVVTGFTNKLYEGFRALFIWYPSNYSSEEKKLLFKVDISTLIYACASYFAKTLDTKNINNAYVSGMKEDLNMYGNELNWLVLVYHMGYVLGQVPGLLLLSRPKFSRYVLPGLEIVYGLLTFLQSLAKSTKHLYVLRGNPPELFVRTSVYFLSLSAGNLISGHLQAAAYTNLSGVYGKTGWQWLFIIDGIITIGICILGFTLWTGIPEAGKPMLLTESEYKLVFVRLKRFGIKESKKLDLDVFKRALTDWKWYLFCFNYTIMVICWYPIGYFSLWLKQKGTYTVPEINRYPTICDVIGIIVSFLGTGLVGVFPHWVLYTIGATGTLIGALIMSIYTVPDSAVFAAFYISYFINMTSPILYSYVSVILREDSEQKALIVGSMMTFAQFTVVWIALALFPTSAKNHHRAAPEWNIGWPVSVVLAGLMILSYWLITWLHEREKKQGIAFKNDEFINEYDDHDLDLDSVSVVSSQAGDSRSTAHKRTDKQNVKEVNQSD
ncbi:putative transporter SEO1 [Wickerhamomyces ciferrii]|uniref:Transporter SEO1 n=1 Tax=Wickerhamomyces ciferrii (strain ATCC 14091 / BCRC 22168 / CBS 111 / JCM 3599 / NBRC 0793 / NRRL Y-1031 F-60-10) TaxID=1206466 RepID=K0KGA9_WICCF|nr:putative transporter SEO1 [Wickerhamomyces ciferrii]CCH44195.1 putative transporter SEO1 [Wickerhamomyces ciferrii]